MYNSSLYLFSTILATIGAGAADVQIPYCAATPDYTETFLPPHPPMQGSTPFPLTAKLHGENVMAQEVAVSNIHRN